MYLVEFAIATVVIVLSSASMTTFLSPMFRTIPYWWNSAPLAETGNTDKQESDR